MDVIATGGEKAGTVARLLDGGFFTLRSSRLSAEERVVPRDALSVVDDEGAHLVMIIDELDQLPLYEGRAPTSEESARALELARGRHATTEPADRLPATRQRELARRPYGLATEEDFPPTRAEGPEDF